MDYLWNYLKTAKKPIVCYGTGNAAEKILDLCELYGIKPSGFFASDDFVRNKIFHGYPVTSYADIKAMFGDVIILLCFGSHRPEVMERVTALSKDNELYAPDLPVVGDGIWDEDYIKENCQKLHKVYKLLADEQSKKVFRNVIGYKYTGRLDFLWNCETKDAENMRLLRLGRNENYLDLGAFTGDTVKEFMEATRCGFESIIAVEPDARNFRKLGENIETIKNYCASHGLYDLGSFELMNIAVSDKNGFIEFSQGAARGSGISAKKTTPVECKSVDEICAGKNISYIKMDLEGREEEAIRGAEKTIASLKPKMLISAYHRTDDLWAIPEQVLAIRPDYKLYLRHSPCIPAWEVNYYFI